jgi:hypothetical protein
MTECVGLGYRETERQRERERERENVFSGGKFLRGTEYENSFFTVLFCFARFNSFRLIPSCLFLVGAKWNRAHYY